MSNALDPFQPPREVSSQPVRQERPTGVTVFAILNMLFGILGVLGIVMSAVMIIGSKFMPGPNPVFDKLQEDTFYFVFFVVSLVLGGIFSIVLFVSGIGLLKMSEGARKLAITYAVYAIASSIIGTVVNFFIVFLPMIQQANQAQGQQQFATIGGVVGGIVGGCIGLIFPVAILIYFLRPSVRQTFESWPREP